MPKLMGTHTQEMIDRATELYFQMEKHFAHGGASLMLREIRDMLGLKSNSTTYIYLDLLEEWGLIKHTPGNVRSYVLNVKNYPPVVYGQGTDHTEPLYFPRS
jgi:hypothetical protein